METEIHSNNASPMRQRAALSGLCAAVASVFGKVGLSDVNGPVVSFVVHYMCGTEISSSSDNDGGGDYFFTCNSLVSYGARGVFVIAMLLINAIMMGSFLEGLQESGSVAAVALSTAANFSASAILGIVLFGENVNEVWLVGFLMILAGIFLLTQVKAKTD
mmetsp:Transcript_13855/g.18159  ORF Transcript_13855/g.18159 Transcript_13855/m.18159 type:complete len:161 (-) Transcript_13855:696-1178(-)